MVKMGFTIGTTDNIVITLRMKNVPTALFDPTSIVRYAISNGPTRNKRGVVA